MLSAKVDILEMLNVRKVKKFEISPWSFCFLRPTGIVSQFTVGDMAVPPISL